MSTATISTARCTSDDEPECPKDQCFPKEHFQLYNNLHHHHHHHPEIAGNYNYYRNPVQPYSCICNLRTNPNCCCYSNKDIYKDPYHCESNLNKIQTKRKPRHLNNMKNKSKVKVVKKRSITVKTPKYRSYSSNSIKPSTSNNCQTDEKNQDKPETSGTERDDKVDINSRLKDLEDLLTKFDGGDDDDDDDDDDEDHNNDKNQDENQSTNNDNGTQLIKNDTNLAEFQFEQNPTRKLNNLDDNTATELHKSKSYIVNLIDKALSKELGTVPENRFAKQEFFNMTPKKAIETMTRCSVEKSDSLESFNRFGSCVKGQLNDLLKQLHQIRRGHLKHIQKEAKKLAELEQLVEIIDGIKDMFVE